MDDEVWAKIILMEKTNTLGKAYVRSPVFMVDGSDAGFDGGKIGVNGFRREDEDNDSLVVKTLIEEGCRLKLTQNGDILIKRDDNLNIFLYQHKDSCSSDVVSKLPYGLIQQDKTYKLFDMKTFQAHLSEELQSDHINWSSLERQVGFLFPLLIDFHDFFRPLPCFLLRNSQRIFWTLLSG